MALITDYRPTYWTITIAAVLGVILAVTGHQKAIRVLLAISGVCLLLSVATVLVVGTIEARRERKKRLP